MGDRWPWRLIVGIIFATFLTLILVPVLYSLVADLVRFFRRKDPEPEAKDSRESTPSPILVSPLRTGPESEPEVAAAVRS